MACALDATTGFQKLQGQLDTAVLAEIQQDAYPGIISFSTSPAQSSLEGGGMITVTSATDNTIQIKNITYTLKALQICSPTHPTFMLPGAQKAPVADLVFTFYEKSNSQSANYPTMVLMILPIYESNQETYAAYLNHLIDPESPAVTLQTLFNANERDKSATSIRYSMCVDIANNDSKSSINTLVLYFVRGCSLSQQHAQLLIAKANPLTDYKIPSIILEPWETVMTYNIKQEDGTKTPTSLSSMGFISTTQIDIAMFKKICNYLTMPPKPSGKFNSNENSSYTNQFQCMPIDQVTISGEQVLFDSGTGPTMDKQLQMMEQARQAQLGSGITTTDIIIYALLGFVGLLLISLLSWGFARLGSIDQKTLDVITAFNAAKAANAGSG